VVPCITHTGPVTDTCEKHLTVDDSMISAVKSVNRLLDLLIFSFIIILFDINFSVFNNGLDFCSLFVLLHFTFLILHFTFTQFPTCPW